VSHFVHLDLTIDNPGLDHGCTDGGAVIDNCHAAPKSFWCRRIPATLFAHADECFTISSPLFRGIADVFQAEIDGILPYGMGHLVKEAFDSKAVGVHTNAAPNAKREGQIDMPHVGLLILKVIDKSRTMRGRHQICAEEVVEHITHRQHLGQNVDDLRAGGQSMLNRGDLASIVYFGAEGVMGGWAKESAEELRLSIPHDLYRLSKLLREDCRLWCGVHGDATAKSTAQVGVLHIHIFSINTDCSGYATLVERGPLTAGNDIGYRRCLP